MNLLSTCQQGLGGGSSSSLKVPHGSLSSPEQTSPLHNSCSDDIPEFVGGAETQSISTINDTRFDLVQPSPPPADMAGEASWVWNVACLPKVPVHVPLEHGSLRLPRCTNDNRHSTITQRISDFMRLNSITCSYHTEEARVDCMTTESCLKFVVQLWRGDENDVIVEVQRRRGCSIFMQSIRRCLYKSITNADQICVVYQSYKRRRPSPVLEKRIFQELKKLETMKRKQKGPREQCLALMESDKKDENRLGIETLLVLTDPKKTRPTEAEEIARALIYDEGALAQRLRPVYLAFLQRRWDEEDWSDAECGNTDDASCLEFASERSELFHEHQLALRVLVNSLDLIACHERDYLSNDATNLIELCTPFWTEILNVLVVNLQESCQRPQEAALSAKCIRILECLEPDVASPFVENIVAPLLLSAYEFGKAHHLSLQKESAKLIHMIESSH